MAETQGTSEPDATAPGPAETDAEPSVATITSKKNIIHKLIQKRNDRYSTSRALREQARCTIAVLQPRTRLRRCSARQLTGTC